MRILYFDIDGTLVTPANSQAKPALADGAFEQAVRHAGFTALVCVGSAVSIAHYLEQKESRQDGAGMIFGLCGGAFQDEDWFRSVLHLVAKPEHRALAIQLQADWYYLDDLARYYLEKDGLGEVFTDYRGSRILAPAPEGDGRDVMEWLAGISDNTDL
jgi:hypothetical protein